MTYATHAIEARASRTPSRTSGGSLLRVLGTRTGEFVRRWRERRIQNLDIRQLRALDDRMLKDIGLHRSQIVSAVVHGSPGTLTPRKASAQRAGTPVTSNCPTQFSGRRHRPVP